MINEDENSTPPLPLNAYHLTCPSPSMMYL